MAPPSPVPVAGIPADPTVPGDEEIAALLMELLRRLREHLDGCAAAVDLTLPQAMVLRRLERPCPMRDLADHLRCDPSNITGIVDRLEARDLVTREPLASDRRVKSLTLTPAGRRLRADLERRVALGLAGLPLLDGADRRHLRRILGGLLAR